VIAPLLLATAPTDAWAWTQFQTASGMPVAWPGSCVYWTLTEQDVDNTDFEAPIQPLVPFESVRDAARNAFRAWDEVDCSYLQLIETEPGHIIDVGHHPGAANANRIMLIEEGWVGPDATWRSATAVALTSVFFDAETGQILDADIEINAEYFELTTTDADAVYDIQSLLTHEAGHVVGLGHTSDIGATMVDEADPGETYMRSLHEDDIEGLCTIYPLAEDPETCPEPTGGLDLDGEGAVWCAEPVSGVSGECVFDESVCCCDGAGGLGRCEWAHADSCRRSGGHDVTELDDELACGPLPGSHCCCWHELHRPYCRWLDEGEPCSDRGGFAPEHSGACEPPDGTTCCCQITDRDVTCQWDDTGLCQINGGVSSQDVRSHALCGEFPSGQPASCQCSAAAPRRGGGTGVLRLLVGAFGT
jgi:hypothetical protein